MKSVPALQYNPLGSQGDLIALQTLAAATDNNWIIQNQGTATGNDTSANIDPKWLLVDNIANNGSVTVAMGIFVITVPPFQREPIPIPAGTKSYSFTLTVGTVNVFFSENKLADVQGNFLLVQQTSVKTLIYAFVNYNVGPQAQPLSDLNTSTLFTPTVADMAYNLLPMNTPVGNGWLQFVYNNGTKNVLITPSGANQLQWNGRTFTNAAPLILYPGAWGRLSSDSAVWYFAGFVGNQVTDVASAATTNVYSASETETIRITGAVGITGFDAAPAGTKRQGYFSGAPLLTNSATFILPSGANIQAAANDRFEAISLGGAAGWLISDYVKADGTPVIGGGNIQTFNIAGAATWTKPSSGNMAFIECWGAGGSGGRNSTANGSGGSGGGYSTRFVSLASLGPTEAVTVGAGGPARTTTGNGTAGGQSLFGAWLKAPGGAAGIADVNTIVTGGVGNAGTGGTNGQVSAPLGLNGTGNAGGGGAGAISPGTLGGVSDGTFGTGTGGIGGASAAVNVVPGDGVQPGGGGANSQNANSGKGGDGRVRVTVY